MNRRVTAVVFGLILALPVYPVLAEKTPEPGPADSRVRTVIYSPRDVVEITGHYGYQTLVQFADYEQIENISIGDSLAWAVAPNDRGNMLFIKPVEQNAQTNMAIVTRVPGMGPGASSVQRIYSFALNAKRHHKHRSKDFTWTVQFQYPQDETAAIQRVQARNQLAANAFVSPNGEAGAIDPSAWNFNYSFSGDKTQVPTKIFDDGTFTYFEFDQNTDLPAIFLLDQEQNESLVNGVMQGKYLVVHRTAGQFTLRHGETVTCIFNDSYQNTPDLDQGSPRARADAGGLKLPFGLAIKGSDHTKSPRSRKMGGR